MQSQELLTIKQLSISFKQLGKLNEVIHGISFNVYRNEILAIVGESGSGKSVSSLAVLGLLPKKNTYIEGDIIFNDTPLINLSEKEFQTIRGNEISMIIQEPMSSLNPSMRCGEQVAEILRRHTTLSRKRIKNEVLSLFEKVKLPTVSKIYNAYPHEISGG